MILPLLVVAPSEKRGRGIFASEKIAAETVIEISPVLVLSAKDRQLVEQTLLYDYIFAWGTDGEKACVALGYLSIYNHSYTANCDYEMDYDAEIITIKTICDIEKGEELFINYNGNDGGEVWFEIK